MASPVRVGGVAPGSIAGAAVFQEFLRGYPQKVIDDTRQVLDAGADDLVDAIKARTPVDAMEAHPGALRDSVRKENGRHDLSIVVIEDGADTKGRPIAAHVEYGHKTESVGHAAAVPHFWPAVRESKRKIIARIRSGMRKAAKAAPP